MTRHIVPICALLLCGCGPWAPLFDTTVPSYQPPKVDMEKMDTVSMPDMTPDLPPPDPSLRIPQNVRAISAPEGVRLEWFPVEGAEFYEIQIEDGDWIRGDAQTTFLDENAPFGSVSSAALTASQGDTRAGIQLSVADVQTNPGATQRYKVRAVFTDGAGEPSAEVTGNRESIDTLTYRWEYEESPGMWMLLSATDEAFVDEDAPLNGESRTYRVSIRQQGGEPYQTTAEGMRMAVVQLTSGANHTCALFNSGKVKCWGSNDTGQLGYGDQRSRGDAPLQEPLPYVALPEKISRLFGGTLSTCAVSLSNRLYCWGLRDRFELGEGEEYIMDEPGELPLEYQLPSQPQKMRIDIDLASFVIFFEDKTLKEFEFDQSPTQVSDLRSSDVIVDIATGFVVAPFVYLHDNNQISYKSTASGFTQWATFQLNGSGVRLNAGVPNGDSYCVLYKRNPSDDLLQTYCWGRNTFGLLGENAPRQVEPVGNEMLEQTVPNLVASGSRDIIMSEHAACALSSSDAVSCWGSGLRGQLGLGNTTDCKGPQCNLTNPVLRDVRQLTAGNTHFCALMNYGAVKCWGKNDDGQLGYGNTDDLGDEPGEMPPPNVPIWDELPD